MVTDSETEKNESREIIEVGKSSANVPGTRAQQTRNQEIRAAKNTKQIKPKEIRDEAGYK